LTTVKAGITLLQGRKDVPEARKSRRTNKKLPVSAASFLDHTTRQKQKGEGHTTPSMLDKRLTGEFAIQQMSGYQKGVVAVP